MEYTLGPMLGVRGAVRRVHAVRRRKPDTLVPLLWVGLVLLLSPGFGQEPLPRKTIRKVSIRGLKRENESSILAGLKIRIGEAYDPQKVSLETGTLYAMKKFRKVERPEVTELEDGVAITFVVEERPAVHAVEFAGRKSIREGQLRSVIETKTGSLFSEASLQRDREAILEKYQESGYIFARVDAEAKEGPEGVRIIFKIEEGLRVRIRDVKFIGNKSIGSGALLALMETREKDFWLFGLLRPGYYDAQVLQTDLVRLVNYYRRFGYFDARAEVYDISLDPAKRKMAITIHIAEGPQYTFRGYRLSRNAVFSEQTLLRLTRAVPGKPYSAETMEQDQQEIKKYYGERAYIFAKVSPKPEVSEEGHDVYIRFEIEEANEIYIEQVKIQGNEKTQDRVIRRELEFYPGERIDSSKLEKSRSNLNRLQFFKTVNYAFENGSSPSDKTVVVNVEEEQTGRILFGIGLTSGLGVIGNFSVSKRNFDPTDLPDTLYDFPDSFTGAGMTLNIQAQPGTLRSLYRFSLIEPYLFETRNALRISASRLTIFRPDYDESRTTFDPRLSHAFDFDRDFVFSLSHRLEEVQISRVESDAPTDAFVAEGFTTIIAAGAGVSYDKRLYEYLEGHYDGTLSVIEYEYGGGILGGDVDFHRIELANEFYYPIFTHGTGPASLHHVLSLLNRFGVVEPQHAQDEIPIFERYFLGGPNDVRGFDYRELGPHEGRDPIGGTARLYGNLEYSFPIFLKILRGVVFLDYGDLSTDIGTFDLSRMRLAAGGGIRLNFPFFGGPLPIGLYLGVPLRKEDEDREKLFLFTIGAPF